jgi:AhpD family alkylhydroperoxidase
VQINNTATRNARSTCESQAQHVLPAVSAPRGCWRIPAITGILFEWSLGLIGNASGKKSFVNRGRRSEAFSIRLHAPLAHQINGCAFCLDMHWKDLKAAGEGEQRLYGLDAWEESPYYSDREQAALAWTEAVTNVREGHVPDEVYEQVRRSFTEKELADLTLAITAINGWNRLNIAARTVPGTYQPAKARELRKGA